MVWTLIRLPKPQRGVTTEPEETEEPGASISQSSNKTFIRPIKGINVDAAQIAQYQHIGLNDKFSKIDVIQTQSLIIGNDIMIRDHCCCPESTAHLRRYLRRK